MRHEEALNVQAWRWQDAWERKRDYETYYTLSHVFGVLSQELFDRTARPGACICLAANCLALLLAGDRPHRCVYAMAGKLLANCARIAWCHIRPLLLRGHVQVGTRLPAHVASPLAATQAKEAQGRGRCPGEPAVQAVAIAESEPSMA